MLIMVGLLTEDDNGRTDLGTLEKRLAENKRESQRASTVPPGSNPTSPSQTSQVDASTPTSNVASPEAHVVSDSNKRKSGTPEKSEEEVEALSDMMCSLVTNNCGETRYIGISLLLKSIEDFR